MKVAQLEPLGFVAPLWGTRRRTHAEWVTAGGSPSIVDPIDRALWPSLGHEIAEVGVRLLLPPMPHQRYVFDVAGELDPESPEDLWYTEADIWVMRQCGKTMGIIFPILVHRLTRMPKRLGGRQRASFTMQDRQETRKKFEMDMIPQLTEATESFRRVTNPKARPGRSTREWKSSLNNGSEHLLFGQGNYLLIDTPSEKAGHGGTLDLKAADEVRFGVDDRVEASAGPSQITRRSRLFIAASTAGDQRSTYMWPKVKGGRSRVERDDIETRVCSFEWAIPDNADLHDPRVWRDHHPASGHTIQINDILDELRKAEDSPDPAKVDTFRNEHGNQWTRTPQLGDGDRVFVIQPDEWANARLDASAWAGSLSLGVHVAPSGRSASIAVAGMNQNGLLQVEVLKHDSGVFWIEPELAAIRNDREPDSIAYFSGGDTNAVAGAIARAAGDVAVVKLSGNDYRASCEAFRKGIAEGRYCHKDQAWLNSALEEAAKKRSGTGWIWDGQSESSDYAPLPAVTIAARAVEMNPPEPEHRSAYEDHEFMAV